MKKLVSLIVGLALCLGLTSFAFAEGPAPVASEQLDAIETALYGTHQSSSMMERMESLEDDIYGAPDSGRNILDRIKLLPVRQKPGLKNWRILCSGKFSPVP